MDTKKSCLILAAQPTMDRTAFVENFSAGGTYRITSVTRLPSGKANNVARSLNELDMPVHVVELLGGFIGKWIYNELTQLGIKVSPIWVNGENRIAYSVYDPVKLNLTELIEGEDGPVSRSNYDELLRVIDHSLLQSACLVLSGRASCGFPETGYRELVDLAHAKEIPVYIDCYGSLLDSAIISKPDVIKINQFEAGKLLGREINSLQECAKALIEINSIGIKFIVITLGDEGAVAFNGTDLLAAKPPRIIGPSIGSGDAFFAGLIFSLNKNWSFPEILKFSVAVGAANVLIPGAGLFHVYDIEDLFNQVNLISLR